MRNDKLIECLKEYPADAWVTTSRSEDICIAHLKDRKTLFIDPADCCPTCIFYDDGYCREHKTECFNVDGCDVHVELI